MTRSCKDKKKVENMKANYKNKIMIIERDFVRNLITSKNTKRKVITVLSESQFKGIKENSKAISDKFPRSENTAKTFLQNEIKKHETLKQQLEQLKIERNKEIDEEECKRNEEILKRTEEMRKEEEDIIKKCNSLIVSVKCKAIQDAQVAEKELIRQQLKQEEQKTDSKIENERKRAVESIRRKREIEWARNQEYAKCILKQIEHNEEQRVQQIEMIQRENNAIKLKMQKQYEEQKRELEEKSARQLEIKEQNKRINEEIKRNKELERENEIFESLKIQQCLEQKLKEEKEIEERTKREKQLQERELARLWKLQKSSGNLCGLKDDITTERIQEKIQRKWRQHQLEIIKKKIQETKELKNIREKQILEKRKNHISQIEEKKEEAEKIKTDNQKLKKELQELQLKRKQIMEQYKVALKEQIKEKERYKKKQREENLKESEDLLVQIHQHERIIKETMKKKIDQIRKSDIPEVYVKNIEKHMQLS